MPRVPAFAFLFLLPVASAATIYSTIPTPLPPNLPSLGYQATQTAEFGNYIQFSGLQRDLKTVTVMMSDWALASTYGSNQPTWSHDLTLNLYEVDETNPAVPAVGNLIGSRTINASIPWRPEASPGCGTAWQAADGNCYNGFAFTVDFDFSGVTVPDRIVYGLAFNTNTWGYNPIHAPGPYESLNFALSTTGPTVGSNPIDGSAFWNTMTPANYSDNGIGGVGTFRVDTNWQPYSGAISFDADGVPEPGTCGLIAFATAGLLGLKSRRRA